MTEPREHLTFTQDMEDFDVDALINEEMENGGLNSDLAAKLRAFEALDDDE